MAHAKRAQVADATGPDARLTTIAMMEMRAQLTAATHKEAVFERPLPVKTSRPAQPIPVTHKPVACLQQSKDARQLALPVIPSVMTMTPAPLTPVT